MDTFLLVPVPPKLHPLTPKSFLQIRNQTKPAFFRPLDVAMRIADENVDLAIFGSWGDGPLNPVKS